MSEKQQHGCPALESGVVRLGLIIPQPVPTAHQEKPNAIAPPPLRMHPRPLPKR